MAMNTRVPSILFVVIAIAAAVTFLSVNVDLAIAFKDDDLKILDTNPSSYNNMISPNPVSNSNYTNPSSSFNTSPNPVSNTTKPSLDIQDQFNLDQFNQCVKQKTVESNGKLSLSGVAVCYSEIFSNKLLP